MVKFLFSLLLFIPTAGGQDTLINWSASRKLTWADFRGKPDNNSSNAALTSSNIHFSFGYGSEGFHWNIRCQFDPGKSWVRMKSDYILAHEQGHFDIAELFARKLNKAVKAYTFHEATANADLNAMYEKLVRDHHAYQLLYDRETDHSRNREAQQKWSARIAAELRSLAPFANYH